jgi:hypothetical protein
MRTSTDRSGASEKGARIAQGTRDRLAFSDSLQIAAGRPLTTPVGLLQR